MQIQKYQKAEEGEEHNLLEGRRLTSGKTEQGEDYVVLIAPDETALIWDFPDAIYTQSISDLTYTLSVLREQGQI